MTDGNETFESTKARLEEILAQVRKKDTSLEQSLELLEEGVRLANRCNELIDQTSWRAGDAGDADDLEESEEADAADAAGPSRDAGDADAEDLVADAAQDFGRIVEEESPGGDEYPDDERA